MGKNKRFKYGCQLPVISDSRIANRRPSAELQQEDVCSMDFSRKKSIEALVKAMEEGDIGEIAECLLVNCLN
jgi:hypothetical protein